MPVANTYFALSMIGELQLSEACPELNKTHFEEINGEKMAAQIRAVKEHVCGIE